MVPVTGLDGRFALGQIVWLPPVFELVAAPCHWHGAFKWVRVRFQHEKEKHHPFGWCFFFLVPVTGLEPVRHRWRWILSPLRLPFHHTGMNLPL